MHQQNIQKYEVMRNWIKMILFRIGQNFTSFSAGLIQYNQAKLDILWFIRQLRHGLVIGIWIFWKISELAGHSTQYLVSFPEIKMSEFSVPVFFSVCSWCISHMHTFQPPSSSKREVCNKPGISWKLHHSCQNFRFRSLWKPENPIS